jgi:hypothetical protein
VWECGRNTRADFTIWLCKRSGGFTLRGGTDARSECRHGAHASRFHHSPLPLHPRGRHRLAPGTLAGQPPAHQATAARVGGCAVVGRAPRLHRRAEVPGSLVPEPHEGAMAMGRNGGGQPGPGDHTNGTALNHASAPVVRRGHVVPSTGHRVPRRLRAWHGRCHQAARRSIAPRVPLGLGLATPPPGRFAASRAGRLLGGPLAQTVPACGGRASAGSGLLIPCVTRVHRTPRRTMAARMVGAARGEGARQPCAGHPSARWVSVQTRVG